MILWINRDIKRLRDKIIFILNDRILIKIVKKIIFYMFIYIFIYIVDLKTDTLFK